MEKVETLYLGKTERGFEIHRAAVDKDKRTISLAFSSETPYERWYGMEVLDHSPGAINLKRLKRGGALLIDHDTTNQVGVIEDVTVDADRVGRATVRFGRSAKAEEIFQDVLDGIRSNVSVGYMIDDMVLESETDGKKTYKATKWTPYEISLVACPADIEVGVGRSEDAIETKIQIEKTKEIKMDNIVEVGKERKEGEVAERARVADIIAIAKAHKAEDIADSYIREGKTVDSFKTEILAKMIEKKATIDTGVSMSVKEKKEYSYARALLSQVEGNKCLETEVSDTMRKSYPSGHKNRGGVIVPLEIRAGLDSGAATAGAEFAYTNYAGSIIELLRNQAVLPQLGATVMTLDSAVSFPVVSTEGAASWVAENPGSDSSDTDDVYTSRSISPKSITRSTSISRQLLVVSVSSGDAMIRNSIGSSVSLAIDQAGIHGSGASNQPTGIYAASSTNAKAMGGVPTFGKLVDMATEVAIDNALMGNLGFVTTPGMAGKLMQTLVASSAGSAMIWSGNHLTGTVAGYRGIASSQVSAVMTGSTKTGGSEHGIIYGNFADLLIALFGGVEITVDPYRLKKQAMIEYTIFGMADVLVKRPQSFCKATGATIS